MSCIGGRLSTRASFFGAIGLRGLGLMMVGVLAGCVSASRINDRFAERQGWEILDMVGTGFSHRVYFSPGDGTPELHVYVDGDGRPWLRRSQINLRPETPRPLMLRAMSRDARPALYLTRPCYFQQLDAEKCSPWYWTQGRYSPEVVESMAAVVRRWVAERGHARVWLYGHSGGGSIVMLMSRHLPSLTGIVTVAANLDTAAWTRHHGYSPLSGSLNPADVDRCMSSCAETSPPSKRRGSEGGQGSAGRGAPYAPGITQFHYLGADDRNVPPGLFPVALRAPAVVVRIVPGQAHQCCWYDYWPTILQDTRGSFAQTE